MRFLSIGALGVLLFAALQAQAKPIDTLPPAEEPLSRAHTGRSTHMREVHIDCSRSSITDTDIADKMRYPAPSSVKNLIQYIEEQYPKEVISVNIARNNISMKGMCEFLDFVLDEMPSLASLDVSYNKLDNGRVEIDVQDKFTSKLKELLHRSHFNQFCFNGNEIATLDWVTNFASQLGPEEKEKLIWQSGH